MKEIREKLERYKVTKRYSVFRPEATPARLVIKNEFNLAWMGVETKRINKWQLGSYDSTGLLRNLLEWNNNHASSALAEAAPAMCFCQLLVCLCQINVTFNLLTFKYTANRLWSVTIMNIRLSFVVLTCFLELFPCTFFKTFLIARSWSQLFLLFEETIVKFVYIPCWLGISGIEFSFFELEPDY